MTKEQLEFIEKACRDFKINNNMKDTITIDGVSYTRTDLVATLKSKSKTKNTKTKEERFWEIFNPGKIKWDKEKRPNSIFGFTKDGELLWEYDSKNNTCWLRWILIWLVFEKEYGLTYDEIQSFTSNLLEEHFKSKGLTTSVKRITTC